MIQAVILESVGIDNQYEPNERYLQFFSIPCFYLVLIFILEYKCLYTK